MKRLALIALAVACIRVVQRHRANRSRPLRRPRRRSPRTSRRSSSTTARIAIGRAKWRRCRCCPTRTCGRGRRRSRPRSMSREMPPWGADMSQTLPMRNDLSLSQKQIDTIAAWVDGGAPGATTRTCRRRRTSRPAGPPAASPTSCSRCRSSSSIPAEGELGVQMFYSQIPFTEDSFAEVLELQAGQPRGRAPRRHLLRRYSRRHDARRRPHGRQGRQGRSAIAARAACRDRTAACPVRASCCRGCRAAASTIIGRHRQAHSRPASTSTGRCTTTRPASRRKIARGSASGSTRSRSRTKC